MGNTNMKRIASYRGIERNILQPDDIVLSVDGTTTRLALVPKDEKNKMEISKEGNATAMPD